SSPRIPPPHHGTGRTPDASSHFVQGQFRAKKFQRTPAPVGQQVGRTLGSHRDLQSCGDPIIALFYVRAISLLPFPTRTYTTAQSPAACILHPRTANAYTVGPSPAPGSVRCLQLLGRTWLAPIPESRDHPLHRPFLDKLISENGPAENPQEIILNSLPCKCLFLWDLSRHRFQPDCLLRPLVLSCSVSEASVEEVKLAGPLMMLHALAEAIGLPDLLGEYAHETLALVYAHCLDYKSLNRMLHWAYTRARVSWAYSPNRSGNPIA